MKNSKFWKLLLALALALAAVLALSSCEGLLDTDDDGSEYEGKSYTVTFDSTGGTEVAAQTVARGNYATEPTAPTKPGYVFRGWYSGAIKWNFESYKITKNVTLEARWAESSVQYTVTFEAGCDASLINPDRPIPAAQTVYEAYTVTEPARPRRTDGYRFEGWQLGAREYDFSSAVTENITLTAKWVKKPDNLIYDRESLVRIVIPDPTDTENWTTVQSNKVGEVLTKLGKFFDDGISYIKDNEVPPETIEIVFGYCAENTNRTISVEAYELLAEYKQENEIGEDKGAFLIYCDGTSIAVAYDNVEGDLVAIAAIDYFMNNIHKYELVGSAGIMYHGTVDLPAQSSDDVDDNIDPDGYTQPEPR